MSDSQTMAFEERKLNLREEEKFLDDKLMEIGLLEPGMSLEEKRELASVLLESTRMAQEQMSQREKEEEWELMVLSEDDSKDRAGTSKGKVRTDKGCASSTENKDKASTTGFKNTNSNKYKSQIFKEDGVRNETERGKDDSREKAEMEKLSAAKDKKEREMAMKREKRDRQRKAEEEARRERQMKGKEEERERRLRERRKGENRTVKDVVIIDDERKERAEKSSCTSEKLDKSDVEHKKEKGEIAKTSFYGPSHLLESNNPNPFSTEIYGTTAKRCPPRNNNLLKLVEEDMRNKLAEAANKEKTTKESEHILKTQEDKSTAAKEMHKQTKENVITSGEQCSTKSLGKGRREKDIQDGDKESVTKDDRLAIFPKRELESSKDGNRTRSRKMISLAMSSANAAKTQEEDVSCEKRRREEESNDSSSVTLIEEFEKEGEDISNGELKTPDEKKRRLEKGQVSRKWSDVAAGKKFSLPEEDDEAENSSETTSIKLIPNKRWRRVKRNFKSSFGSGSEVDEWISSDEDKKAKPKLLTKDQIVARFDNSLLRIKNALQKQQPSESQNKSEKIKNHVCRKSKYKVPPGFQEPDSDDDCNLWKICFGDKLAITSKSENEESKPDTPATVSKTIMTRSRLRQRNSVSPSLSSKSVSSMEERGASSPLRMSPLKEILPGPSTQLNDESQSACIPSLKEIALINKVTCPTSTISRSTQTYRDSDSDSDHSSSTSTGNAPPSTKSNEVTEECKPTWDLFEEVEEKFEEKKDDVVDEDEVELVDLSSGDGSKPDSVNCPICNRAFPMAEIEAHASVCNAEEEDSSDGEPFTDPRTTRENLRSHRMLSKATGVGISSTSDQSRMEIDIPEEIIGDSSHEEEEEEGDDYQPKPARLAPFIPISQQRDSCINYHDQFPEISSNANLQASLERIRKKLMKAGTKKRGWKRRKKGRKRMAKK